MRPQVSKCLPLVLFNQHYLFGPSATANNMSNTPLLNSHVILSF